MSKENFLEITSNLSMFHREHEKFYGQAPLQTAIEIQDASKTLKTIADRWIGLSDTKEARGNPYMGCEDLNEKATIQHDGLLFMEGEGEPTEISQLKRKLKNISDDFDKAGVWLLKAMENSWEAAIQLMKIPMLEAVLGERHRIIINDWQASHLSILVAKLLDRALLILNQIDFQPNAIREDISTRKRYPDLLYSASELLDRGADLSSEFAMLIHDNERRWRVFRQRVNMMKTGSTKASK
jgi:hypothetical protein